MVKRVTSLRLPHIPVRTPGSKRLETAQVLLKYKGSTVYYSYLSSLAVGTSSPCSFYGTSSEDPERKRERVGRYSKELRGEEDERGENEKKKDE